MMNERNISHTYWVEAIHTVVHILNKAHISPQSDKTPYELWFGRPTSSSILQSLGLSVISRIMMKILANMMTGIMKVYS